MEQTNHFVYILKCSDNTLYTGYTTDVSKRIRMHEQGKGAKYTRGRSPFELVFQASCSTKSDALQLEARIKKLSRKEKIKLVTDYARGGKGIANPKKLSGES